MKTIIFNDDNLEENEAEDVILKARAVIINDKKEVLISHCAGFYLFPGGKLLKNEPPIDGLIREVKEETGIILNKNEIKPFIRINHIIKHYPKREKNNIFGSRENITDYYIVRTNKNMNTSKINLTKYEKAANFQTIKIKIEDVPYIINNDLKNDIRAKCFSREINAIICELEKIFHKI